MADSIREALTKAVAEAEAPSSPESATTTPPPDQSVPTGTDASTAKEPGTDADTKAESGADSTPDTKGNDSPKPAAAAPSQTAPGDAATTPSSQQQGATTPSPEQPPASWSVDERKHWAAIPKEAQAAIRRRETEMRRAISASQEATHHKRQFEQALDRFQPLLKEKGVTDVMGQVIGPLMTMRAGLEIGTPEQKAGLVATIVRDFGIGIEVLDKALAEMADRGALRPGARSAPAPAPFNARQVPELAPLFQMAERLKEAQAAKANAAIAEVEQLPDFDDLRNTMADIIDAATQAGKEVTVVQAYDRARAFHGLEPRIKPQISVSEAASALAKSRNAASSVSGAPKSSPAKKANDLRGQLEAAWSSAHS